MSSTHIQRKRPEAGPVQCVMAGRLGRSNIFLRLAVRACIPESQLSVQRKVKTCSCGGGCPGCSPPSGHIQPKLKIGAPNDKYEQEADRVAGQVMRMPDSTVQRQTNEEEEEEPLQAKPLANTITPLIQRQPEPEDDEEVMKKTGGRRRGKNP